MQVKGRSSLRPAPRLAWSTSAYSDQGNYADSGSLSAVEAENGYDIVFDEDILLECTHDSGTLDCTTDNTEDFPSPDFVFSRLAE